MDLRAFVTSTPFLVWLAVMLLTGVLIFFILRRK